MKIGTINIDWFKKSKAVKDLIVEKINKQDFDFLIVTKNILSFQFNENYFNYHSIPIPTDAEFQHLHYGEYLKGEIPIRTSIFSKHQSASQINTNDTYTSLCHKFIIEEKEICIYGTMIGSYGIKYQNEIARPELDNFKSDIQSIFSVNQNVFIAGDFNTSFYKDENRQLATIQSRDEIINFTNGLNISRSTEKMEQTIDHIFISEKLNVQAHVLPLTFLSNDILKDEPHQGILLEVDFYP